MPALGAALAGKFGEGAVHRLHHLFPVHHDRAGFGKLFLFAGARVQLVQFGDGVAKILLLRPCPADLGRRFLARHLDLPPRAVSRADLGKRGLQPGIGVQDGTVGLRVQQAVGIELAVDFDQGLPQPAQQRDADRLIVDIGAAAAVGRDDPAQHQRILDLQALLAHQR